MPPDELRMMQMLWGFALSQALHVAAKLGVFDVIRDEPRTASEIAEATASHASALRRLLRLLTAVEVLSEDERGRFSATALGALLRSDHPQSARPQAVLRGEPFFWHAWGDLYETVRTGRPAFDRVHGEAFFDYLARRPPDAAIFDAAMTSLSSVDVPAILEAYDFSGCTRIVDVAGGQGALLQGILERYPKAEGVLCDQPAVLDGAVALRESAVATRCSFAAADIFESVPAGGDTYVLKRILHDWSDAEATRILRNCRRAIPANGRLLVMDAVLEPPNRPDPAKWMDLNMLVLLMGRERTPEEFRELYRGAGFTLTRVVPAGRVSIVEGVPA
jgi:hypothetical protein